MFYGRLNGDRFYDYEEINFSRRNSKSETMNGTTDIRDEQ